MQKFINLFSEHAGTAYVRQNEFANYLGDRGWSLVLSEGEVKFGEDLSFPVQLIGSESEINGSWMWAWANKESNLPENLLKTSYLMKEYGEKHEITELIEPSYKLTEFNGFVISLLVSSLNGNKCMYRGPYDGGAIFFIVENTPDFLNQNARFEVIIGTMTQMIAGFELNHKIFVESFLSQQGFKVNKRSNFINGKRDHEEIIIEFDEHGRIKDINGKSEQQQKKPWWKVW